MSFVLNGRINSLYGDFMRARQPWHYASSDKQAKSGDLVRTGAGFMYVLILKQPKLRWTVSIFTYCTFKCTFFYLVATLISKYILCVLIFPILTVGNSYMSFDILSEYRAWMLIQTFLYFYYVKAEHPPHLLGRCNQSQGISWVWSFSPSLSLSKNCTLFFSNVGTQEVT